MESAQAELLDRARQLRTDGKSWLECVRVTGLSIFRLKCELQPGFRDRNRYFVNRRRSPEHAAMIKRTIPKAPQQSRASGNYATSVTVPQHVLFERERAMLAPRTLTASLCGDPPAGRSALDKRA